MPRQKQDVNIGKKFGQLTIHSTREIVKWGKKQVFFRCTCDCGNQAEVWKYNLLRGQTSSCGCHRAQVAKEKAMWKAPTDVLPGRRFGRLTVQLVISKKFLGVSETYYRCACDCGKIKEVPRQSLIRGSTKSCGCLRAETAIKNRGNLKTLLAS